MDNLTHTLLGVGMAQAGLSRRFGKGTLLTLVVASNLPDMDWLMTLFGDGYAFLDRRMITHSILGVPLIAAAAASLFRLRVKHISWKALFGLILLGMGVHVLFDLVNSYGVVLFYPLSLKRWELAWIFIIDLTLWGLLIAPLILSRIRSPWTDLQKLSRISLTAIGVYVAFCGLGRARANTLLRKTAVEQHIRPEFSYVFPEALGAHRFRGILKEDNRYSLYLIHVLNGKIEHAASFKTDEDSTLVQKMRKKEFPSKLDWFYKAPVWKIVSQTQEQVEVFDLRFKSLTLKGRHTPFAYRLNGLGEVDVITKRRNR